MKQGYYHLLDAVSGGRVYHPRWMSKLGIPPVPAWTVVWFFDLKELVPRSPMSNTEHEFADTNRHLVEVPDSFVIARWPRDADVPTIARCILGTLKYEPHTADTTSLRRALETLIEHELATAHKFAEAR